MNIKSRKLRGLSLIELMIAMVIGLILLGGAISMFITNKRIYQEQNEMGLLQENARFAMGLLVDDIRMAGYIGCHNDIGSLTSILNESTDIDMLDLVHNGKENLIEGVDNKGDNSKWEPTDSNEDVSGMSAGTDAITIRYLQPVGKITSSNSGGLTVEKDRADSVIRTGDILAISDCDSADIFKTTSTNTGKTINITHPASTTSSSLGNSTGNLSKIYLVGASINRVIARRYFIKNSGNSTGPALWWSHILEEGTLAAGKLSEEELIEGVENMQILYGEDTSGNGAVDNYVTATVVTDWTAVISVRIALLMRTVDEYGTIYDTGDASKTGTPNTYTLLGTNITSPGDRHRRRVFSTTVQIRNRQ